MNRLILLGLLFGVHTPPTSGDAIIRAMHDKYAKTWYHTLTFTQKTTRRTPKDSMVIETWNEEAMLPGHLRIEIHSAKPVTAMFVGDSIFVWNSEKVLSRAESRNILLIMGFDVYGQSPEKTLEMLGKEHFPMSPVREDTWEGRPVYVIGSGRRQLWIDKERLLFVRGTEPNGRDSTKGDDFRFDNYVEFPSGWVAESVEEYTDGKLQQLEEYTDVKPNATIDPARFTPPAGTPKS